jgi:hypothetical protein
MLFNVLCFTFFFFTAGHKWYQIHSNVMTLVSLLTLTSFIIIVIAVDNDFGPTYKSRR